MFRNLLPCSVPILSYFICPLCLKLRQPQLSPLIFFYQIISYLCVYCTDCSFKILFQILNILNTNTDPDLILIYSRLELIFFGKMDRNRRCRMKNQCLGVPNIGQNVWKF